MWWKPSKGWRGAHAEGGSLWWRADSNLPHAAAANGQNSRLKPPQKISRNLWTSNNNTWNQNRQSCGSKRSIFSSKRKDERLSWWCSLVCSDIRWRSVNRNMKAGLNTYRMLTSAFICSFVRHRRLRPPECWILRWDRTQARTAVSVFASSLNDTRSFHHVSCLKSCFLWYPDKEVWVFTHLLIST